MLLLSPSLLLAHSGPGGPALTEELFLDFFGELFTLSGFFGETTVALPVELGGTADIAQPGRSSGI